MRISRDNIIRIIFYLSVFLALFVFWTRISPIMVGDADDWAYISYSRQALPTWHGWNPAKVFPETIMGLCGYFAAYVVYPICDDYIMAMTYVFAVMTSVLVIIYLFEFGRLVRLVFAFCLGDELFSIFTFFCVHFLLLNHLDNNNSYLLMAERLVCVTNYLWPMLICASFSMYLLGRRYGKEQKNLFEINGKGLFLLLIYISVFSNIVTNIILVANVAINLLIDLFSEIKSKGNFLTYLKTHVFGLVVILCDFVALFFEYHGGRASVAQKNVGQTIEDLRIVLSSMNKLCVGIMLTIIVTGFMITIVSKNKQILLMQVEILFDLLIVGIYLFALLSKVGDHKFLYTDNLIVLFFYFNLVFACSLAFILSKGGTMLKVILPLAAYIMFFMVMNTGTYMGNDFAGGGHLYRSVCSGYSNYHECYSDGTNIVEQFIEADMQGLDEMELIVSSNNLAQFKSSGNRIAMTLYRHGIISKNMNVTVSQRN